jgi:hypothetical protein
MNLRWEDAGFEKHTPACLVPPLQGSGRFLGEKVTQRSRVGLTFNFAPLALRTSAADDWRGNGTVARGWGIQWANVGARGTAKVKKAHP